MRRRRHLFVCALFLSLALSAGCERDTTPGPPGILNVVVSIVPQRYFVERIGGEQVAVTVMVEPGANPTTYEPRPEQLAALSDADVYFAIGVPFEEAWLDRFAAVNGAMRVVDTTEGIERMPMAAHRHLEGDGQLSAVEPERPDPHVWLSPALVKVQAHTVCETLAALDPGHREVYEENLERFVAEVDALDGEIRELLGGLEATKFLVFHPSWGYFARDYGLEMVPVEVGGQEPGAAELAAFIEEARVEDVRVIFAQPEFSTRAATVIAGEIDGQVLLASPLAPDWPDNLRRVAQTFAEVLAP